MAGISWIKIETTLPNKPVVLKLRRLLKKGRSEIVGMLVQLLCWADGATEDGSLGEMLPEDIDYIVNSEGFGQALIDAGWLVDDEHGLRFKDWESHNGYTAKRRAMKARGMEISRSGQSVDKTDHKTAQSVHLDKIREDKNIHANACNARVRAKERVREASSGHDNSGDTFAIQQGSATVYVEKKDGNDVFYSVYKKQPKSIRAYQVEWANAVKREKPEVLIECAKIYRENMTDEDYRFQLPPERWLADCRYEQFVKQAKQNVKQKGSALPVLPWEEE